MPRRLLSASPCARVLLYFQHSLVKVLLLAVDSQPITLGRHPSSQVCLSHPAISLNHAVLWTTRSPTDDVLVCCQDSSLNGSYCNDVHFRNTTIVLCNNDELRLGPGYILRYQHFAPPGSFQDMSTQSDPPPAFLPYVRHVPSIPRDACPYFKFQVHEDYKISARTLGRGAFAVVHLAHDAKGQQVACKIIKKKRVPGGLHQQMREVETLASINHPNICGYLNRGSDHVNFYIFMELYANSTSTDLTDLIMTQKLIFNQRIVGTDLFEYVASSPQMSDSEIKYIGFQVSEALDYLHSECNIAHLDVKLENVMLKGLGPFPHVLLADFGSARGSEELLTSLCGTVVLLPPEVLRNDVNETGYDPLLVDSWAYGMMLFMMAWNYNPWQVSTRDTANEQVICQRIHKLSRPSLPVVQGDDAICVFNILHAQDSPASLRYQGVHDDKHDNDFKDLVSKLLHPDPDIRMPISYVFSHNWMAKSREDLEAAYRMKVLKYKM